MLREIKGQTTVLCVTVALPSFSLGLILLTSAAKSELIITRSERL